MKRPLTEVIENYKYTSVEEEETFKRAAIHNGVLRSTKLFLNEDTGNTITSTWEIHFTLHVMNHDDEVFSRLVTETIVNFDETDAPGEIMNIELSPWFSPEDIEVLRQRMTWDAGYPLENITDTEMDLMDTDWTWNIERKEWSAEEMYNLLKLNDTEAEELRERWEKQQVYRKFGL
jgi:hypothetical protein